MRPDEQEQSSDDLPLVAVVYGTRSFGVFDLADAAAGLCRLAFLTDGDRSLVRLLSHLGPTVEMGAAEDAEVLEQTRRLAPDGIITFTDGYLERTAFLARALGLPYHSPEVAATLLGKHEQRQALRRAGLPGPAFARLDTARPDAAVLDDLVYPVVVKPDRGAGSRETVLANDRDEVRDAVVHSRTAGIDAVVVEEYLRDDPEAMSPDYASFVSVETVVGHGLRRHVAVCGKLPLAHPFRETGHFVPSHLGEDRLGGAVDTADAAIVALGIEIGVVHTEVKLTPSGPRVIEVNGRVAGAVPAVLARASGYSLIRAAFEAALGLARPGTGLVPCERIGYRINVQPPTWASRVRSIEGLDALAAIPEVGTVAVLRNDGDPVDWRLGTDELVMAIIGAVDSLDDLETVRHQIDKVVTVSYE